MATQADKTIEVQWSTHSDPSKVGKKERLKPREAHAAVRTGMAKYVDDKDVPPVRPSMLTRDDALKEGAKKVAEKTVEPAPAAAKK